MRNKKLFLSAVIITTSMLLFTGCGNKAVTVSAEPAEPAEIISEVNAEESVESSESMETVLDSTDEATVEPEEEAQNLVEEQPVDIQMTVNEEAYTVEEITLTEMNIQMVANTEAYTYENPTNESIRVGVVQSGEVVNVVGQVEDTNWFKIEQGDGVEDDIIASFIDGEFLSEYTEPEEAPAPVVVEETPVTVPAEPQVQQPTTSTDTADNTGSTESSSDTSQSQQSQQLDILPDSDTTSSNGPEIGDIIGYTDTGNPAIWGGTWSFD